MIKFCVERRYTSVDGYDMFVVARFDKYPEASLLRVEVGFGSPANYKIRTDRSGREYIAAKGHVFKAV